MKRWTLYEVHAAPASAFTRHPSGASGKRLPYDDFAAVDRMIQARGGQPQPE